MSSTHELSAAAYLPVLKSLAIAGSLWNAGSMTTAYRLLPAIYPTVSKSPQDAAKQWEFYYWTLSATVPLADLATFIVIGSLGYIEHLENKAGLSWKIWATGAGIMPIGWVWVRKVMLPPSDKLLAVAAGKAEGSALLSEEKKTLDLLKQFNWQMGVRMMFPWVVGGLALWASLGV